VLSAKGGYLFDQVRSTTASGTVRRLHVLKVQMMDVRP